MIYLIVNMIVYLLCALALGIGAGWLWRNVQAAAREQALERQLMDVRGRLSPLEARVQTAERQLAVAQDELASRDETVRLRNREIEGLERVVRELQERLDAAAAPRAEDAVAGAVPPARVAALEGALRRAGAELEQLRSAMAAEQRRVEGLLRERELQHASLKALEQRLKITQERHAAAAPPAADRGG
jgi:predicted  nucleic acid-binding Zn-ribbon protein